MQWCLRFSFRVFAFTVCFLHDCATFKIRLSHAFVFQFFRFHLDAHALGRLETIFAFLRFFSMRTVFGWLDETLMSQGNRLFIGSPVYINNKYSENVAFSKTAILCYAFALRLHYVSYMLHLCFGWNKSVNTTVLCVFILITSTKIVTVTGVKLLLLPSTPNFPTNYCGNASTGVYCDHRNSFMSCFAS